MPTRKSEQQEQAIVGHPDNMVTLIGVLPSEVYDMLRHDAPSGQNERNFPADWHRLGIIDRAWIGAVDSAP